MIRRSTTEPVDPTLLRHALDRHPSGVCVATAQVDGQPVGLVVEGMSRLSESEPLVVFSFPKSRVSGGPIREAALVCVNVLSSEQGDVCRQVANGTIDWSTVPWRVGTADTVTLPGAVACLECEVHRLVDVGDSVIVVARVLAVGVQGSTLPLLKYQGIYGRFSPLSFVSHAGQDLMTDLRVGDAIRGEMEVLSQRTELECTAVARVGNELVIIVRAGSPSGSNPRRELGLRVPFVPPLGSVLAAYDRDAHDVWIGQLGSSAPRALLDSLEVKVARIRTRGWSLALRTDHHDELDRGLVDFTMGRLSPQDQQRFLGLIVNLQDSFEPAEVSASNVYEVYSLRAPVFDSEGRASISVQLLGPRGLVTGTQLLAWKTSLLASTARMSSALQGRHRSSHEMHRP